MRKFTEEERKYILENESKMSLQALAKVFNCRWEEVYDAYSLTFELGEYRQHMFKKYCESLHNKLAIVGEFEIEKDKPKIQTTDDLQSMTIEQIDQLIDNHIESLIQSLKYSKRKLHQEFSDVT
jgi:hypothetical protein